MLTPAFHKIKRLIIAKYVGHTILQKLLYQTYKIAWLCIYSLRAWGWFIDMSNYWPQNLELYRRKYFYCVKIFLKVRGHGHTIHIEEVFVCPYIYHSELWYCFQSLRQQRMKGETMWGSLIRLKKGLFRQMQL